RAVVDLLTCNVQRFGVVAIQDQSGERLGARDIGALAYVHEQGVGADVERLEPGQPELLVDRGNLAWREWTHGFRDGPDMSGRGTTATPDNIEEAGLRELAQDARHILGRLVVLAHLVG